jgi:hypothetical protein
MELPPHFSEVELKSHMLLLREVLADAGTWCCTSTTRDFNTITGRVANEGISFLTISLPEFGKDFHKSLDQGKVARADFAGYAKSGYLPKFLSGFTSLIFDARSGLLLDEPNIDAIRSIRQICYLFSKVDLPCSDARVVAAMRQFVKCEQDVREADRNRSHGDLRHFQEVCMRLFGDVMSNVDRKIYYGQVVPKHGPGATADKLKGNQKFNQRTWTERLDEIFHHSEYLYPSVSHFLEGHPLDILEPGAEIPVRVITVPKTMKTPRIIAIEPTCMQYMQQAIGIELVESLEAHSVTRNLIGFSDQEPNQLMARQGSLDGSLATLDLSEASDRVSNQLVRQMLAPFPWLAMGVDASRSRKADVPGFGVLRLAKFASMGSALCFPIEAMVFLAIVFVGIEKELKRPLGRRDLNDFAGKVRIYGDDIIVPADFVRSVVSTLQDFGLVVNESKSFWTGKFRESCGKEYYDGNDVSVVKCRRMLPSQRRHVPEIVSAVSLRNQLNAACAWKTVEYLDGLIERFIPLPYVLPTSQGLGKHSFDCRFASERMCPRLQRPLVRAAVITERIPQSNLDGYGALLKYFLKRGDKPFADSRHLERAGRPLAVNIKLRWVCPY